MGAPENLDDGPTKFIPRPQTPSLHAGQKLFGRYTLKSILGRGGMGIVWLAFDEQLERNVALKFLPSLVVHDHAILDDLKRETKRSLELTHRNIVRTFDFVQDAQIACISMEYVDGHTLSALRVARPTKVFEVEQLEPLIPDLCAALAYAHTEAKIVHRDLKPANLMLNQGGLLKVTDFGIARSLSDSVTALTMHTSGTLAYMSPQQVDGDRASPLDDIYAVGATLYELLTSKPPFYTGSIEQQIHEKTAPRMRDRRIDLGIASDSAIADNWEDTVAYCLAKDPQHRPQTMAALAARLNGTETGPPVRLQSSEAALAHSAKRFAKPLLLAGIICLLTLSALSLYFLRPNASPSERVAEASPAATGAPQEVGSKTASSKVSVASPTRAVSPQVAPDANSSLEEGMRDYVRALEYSYGMGRLNIDQNEAARSLKSAAAKHFPEAEALLGVWTMNGLHGVAEESKVGQELLASALAHGLADRADKGIATAQNALAVCFEEGAGMGKDMAKAVTLYQKAADQDDATAQTNLGLLYRSGTAVSKDLATAAKLFEKAAKHGNAVAQYELASLYENGKGVTEDLARAVALYKEAAYQEFAPAQNNLANLYRSGNGVAKDVAKAIELYQKSAAQGDAGAQKNLGNLYFEGTGLPKDVSKAVGWFQKAADQKNAGAQNNLGYLYQHGIGVEKDLSKAISLFGQSASQGSAAAQNNLATLYEDGTGVAQDPRKAVELYEKAAEQGNTAAQRSLGHCYEKGAGVVKDLAHAVDLYRKAIDRGDGEAKKDFERLYEEVHSTPVDVHDDYYSPSGSRDNQSYWDGEGVKGAPSIKISLRKQSASFYKGDTLVGMAQLSTGRKYFRTPKGNFTITEKDKDHDDGGPMPYYMALTKSVSLHAGYLPGYPASDGDIRMPEFMAEDFFNSVSIGTPVTITE